MQRHPIDKCGQFKNIFLIMEYREKSVSETLPNPNLQIAQLKFSLNLPEYYRNESMKKELYNYIITEDMAPYYEIVCNDLKWELNKDVLKAMQDRNTKALKEFDEDVEYALNNLTAADTKQAYLNKANYLSKIGDKENTIKVLRQAYEFTIALGFKLDNVFHSTRIGLFFMDIQLIKRNLQQADYLIAQGADWHSRNCYQMLKALYSLSVRDFITATHLFINAVSTFVCTEIMSYMDFIKYTIISSTLTLDRGALKKKILDNADAQQALHSHNVLREYLHSLYDCDYKLFFLRLSDIEVLMKKDMLLNDHYKLYIREMKAKAYDQLMSTYNSVKISYVADQFGVSEDYIENEVSRLIASKKLNYRIDKVNQIIINVTQKSKSNVFRNIIKHGDLLLNRIHKLSRVINI